MASAQAAARSGPELEILRLGRCEYSATWQRMQDYTAQRDSSSADQLWLLEHTPVYTLGQAGRREHLLAPGRIPIVTSDRGGQVTYHGPGQLIAYVLVDLKRRGLGVRRLVTALEQAAIGLLAELDIAAVARPDAPGVYVGECKIASLGLRVRRGCSYHGLSLNVDMDLEPFTGINPCGYAGLKVTRLKDLGVNAGVWELAEPLARQLQRQLAAATHPG